MLCTDKLFFDKTFIWLTNLLLGLLVSFCVKHCWSKNSVNSILARAFQRGWQGPPSTTLSKYWDCFPLLPSLCVHSAHPPPRSICAYNAFSLPCIPTNNDKSSKPSCLQQEFCWLTPLPLPLLWFFHAKQRNVYSPHIVHQSQMETMILHKSGLVKSMSLLGYLQKHQWEIFYRTMDAYKVT